MQVTVYGSEKDLPTNLLEKGEYDVSVIDAVDAISQKTQVEMIKLTVEVWIGDKVRCRLFDYLLDALPSKLRHACDTFGLLSKYETGNLCANDFKGRNGKAKIGVQVDKTGQYPTKNTIQDYVINGGRRIQSKSGDVDSPVYMKPLNEEDLPF